MRTILALILITFNLILVNAQIECSNLKSKGFHEKSNKSLSINQIKETERYDVHFYKLNLTLSNLSSEISGIVDIHATANETIDSALFELYPTLSISEIRVNGIASEFSRNNSAVKVPVNVINNEKFILSIDYHGIPPTTGDNPMGGSGLTNKIDPVYSHQVTASLSEPYSAYEWWPCKQSLKDKADSCVVMITVPTNCKAGSNGILQKVIDVGNGQSRYEWKHNHPIESYLISVAVAEYDEYITYAHPTDSPTPVLIQNYIYNSPQCLIDWKTNIDETADYIELFSDLYGLYPFYNEKYGHCMAPIGGGMEHQTMTTQSDFNKNLTAHELGHQWFGDHVTCASWKDIWVNEGFATYSQYLMLEHLYPTERKGQMENYHAEVLKEDGGSVYVDDTTYAKRIFDYRLTYAKGAGIINTMRFVINNDSLFFKGLREFQTKFGDSVATGLDVKKCLEDASGIDLTSVFDEWYFGESYPNYKVKWNIIGYDLSLEIAQYGAGPFASKKFTNPLEISFSRVNQNDTTIRFTVSELVNTYFIKSIGRVTNIKEIDPYNWVINKAERPLFDPKLEVNYSSDSTYTDFIVLTPNPTNDIFIAIDRSPGKHVIRVTDLNGKLVVEKEFEIDVSVDLTSFASGIYLVYIKSEYGNTHIRRIVKD